MSIIERTLNRFGLVTQKQAQTAVQEAVKRELDNLPLWLAEHAESERWNQPEPIIYANQADLYRLSPILGTALDIVAGDVGLTKFNVKRVVGEDVRDIPLHELEILLRAPNPLNTGMELLSSTVRGYKLNGNHVWWLNRPDPYSKPTEIWEIPYEKITPIPDGRFYLSRYDYFPGNGKTEVPLPPWQIVHFKTYNPRSQFNGISAIESLIETIVGDLGQRKTSAKTYTQYGGAPQSILAFKDWVADEAWTDIKKEKQAAAMRNEMMMLRGVGDGVSWMARAMSSKDMEFIETMKQNMTDVFNRMCPGLLSMLSENATEANALAARATYAEKTLWPMLEVIAQKITADILPVYGRKLIGMFDDPRVVDRKLELEEMAAFERSHTIEETRREYYEDDPIGDDRDKLFVSQINAQSGDIQKPPPAASPFGGNPQPKQLPDGQEVIDATAEEMPMMDNEAEDVSAKAAIADLKIYKRMAIKGKSAKLAAFRSDAIPAGMLREIAAKLAGLKDTAEIVALFDRKIDSFKPQPKVSSLHILRSIEAGVRALEAVRK